MRLQVGRLSRGSYWALVLIFVVGKIAFAKTLGGIPLLVLILAGTYLLISARLHDFSAPSWLAKALVALIFLPGVLLGIGMALKMGPGAQLISLQDLFAESPWLLALLIAPEPLLLLIAGTVPGNVGHNAYGPPQQGVFGIIPRSVERTASVNTGPAADRLDSVLGGRPSQSQQGSALGPRAARRVGSSSFGLR